MLYIEGSVVFVLIFLFLFERNVYWGMCFSGACIRVRGLSLMMCVKPGIITID